MEHVGRSEPHAPEAPRILLAEGERFAGRFLVESTLRADALGVTYRVQDRDGAERALRVFDPQLTADGDAARAAEDATAKLQGLTHKNLAEIDGWWADGDLCGVSMERVEGRTLARLLEKRAQAGKTFNLKGAYNLVAHVCNALTAAEIPCGLLRPSGIAVTAQGRVKIEGLGYTSLWPAARDFQGAMSPWDAMCFTGAPTAQSRDLVALGAILRAMLTGAPDASDEAVEAAQPGLLPILAACADGRYTRPAQLKAALSKLLNPGEGPLGQPTPSAVMTPAPVKAPTPEVAAPPSEPPAVAQPAPADDATAVVGGEVMDSTAMMDALAHFDALSAEAPGGQAEDASTPAGATQVVDVPEAAIRAFDQAHAQPLGGEDTDVAGPGEADEDEVLSSAPPESAIPAVEAPAVGALAAEAPKADIPKAAPSEAAAIPALDQTEMLLDEDELIMEVTGAPIVAEAKEAAAPPPAPPAPPATPAIPPPLTASRRRGAPPTLNKLPEHDAAPVASPGGFVIPDLGYHSALDPEALRWIVRREGLDYGPYSSNQIVQQLFKEEIDTEQLLFDVETEEIRPISDIEFFEEILHKWAHERAARLRKKEEEEIAKKGRRRNAIINGTLLGLILLIGGSVGGYFWYQSTLPTPVRSDIAQAITPFEAALPAAILPDEAPITEAERIEKARSASRAAAVARARAEQAKIRREREIAESSNLDLSAGDGAKFQLKALNGAVAARHGRLSKCLTAEARRDPTAKVLKVKMTALPQGQVLNVSLVKGSAGGNRCVREALDGIKIPPFSGTNRTVTLPFTIRK